jgi:hypothetical protein
MPDTIKTPSYIKALLSPSGKKSAGRKVWSVDLETVWIPFFTATNVQGDTVIPREALGAPLRLSLDKDGSPKFSTAGRPVLKVAAELANQVKLVRENFVAGLVNYAGQVMTQRPDDYKAEVAACHEAGAPIIQKANEALAEAIARMAGQHKTETPQEKVAVGAAA